MSITAEIRTATSTSSRHRGGWGLQPSHIVGLLSAAMAAPVLRAIGLLIVGLPILGPPSIGPMIASAQEVTSLQAAVTIEKALVKAIAEAEGSVVSIARVDREEVSSRDVRPDFFEGLRPSPATLGLAQQVDPRDPDFVPNEFATGVVVDRRGLILTNYHVHRADSTYWVTTVGRKVFRARFKAADPRSDLAVLEVVDPVTESDFAPIKFGDADTLKKGQIVIALGNPYTIARDGQASASWGIVSNLARKAGASPGVDVPGGKTTLHHFGTLIHTDAKLNLGTSGGALLNLHGEMIGLTTAQAATAGYEQAAGFAIPVNVTFRRVLEVLKQGREVEYGFLGVGTEHLTLSETRSGKHGVRVTRVRPGSPARRIGIREQDIITHVADIPIHDVDGLMLEVGKLGASAETTVTIDRHGESTTLPVTLAKSFAVWGERIVTAPAPLWRGLRVDYPTAWPELDPQLQLGIHLTDPCVVVTHVEGIASQAGLRRGMLISHVGKQQVANPQQFFDQVAGKQDAVELRMVNLPGQPQSITVPADAQ